jgi:hypothetical protein
MYVIHNGTFPRRSILDALVYNLLAVYVRPIICLSINEAAVQFNHKQRADINPMLFKEAVFHPNRP